MLIRMYDLDGNIVNFKDLQNKGAWCEFGLKTEEAFVQTFGDELFLMLNPAKDTDVLAPDLCERWSDQLCDLKTRNTPFFKARLLYQMYDPQYTVTFNRVKADRYRKYYPFLDLYFWVDWQAVKYTQVNSAGRSTLEIRVNPMRGIWRISFPDVDDMIQSGAPLHKYKNRFEDTKGNARDSYLLDLRDPRFTRVV